MHSESKDHRFQAIHVLKSFLKSFSIPYEASENPDDVDLVVRGATGQKVFVRMGKAGANGVTIKPEVLISPSLTNALGEVHVVTEAGGYGRPVPVNRGEAPKTRINFRDDYENVYLRHALFRRTPNPADFMATVEKMLPYIKSAARKAFAKFKSVLSPMGFAESDLINIGRVHTIAFLHNYAISPIEMDNVKLLAEYLNQRFGELAKVTFKKAANATCLPSSIKSAPSTVAEHSEGLIELISLMSDPDAVSADSEYEEGTYLVVREGGGTVTMEVEADGFLGVDIYLGGDLLNREGVEDLKRDFTSGSLRVVENKEIEEEKDAKKLARRKEAKDKLLLSLTAMDKESRDAVLAYAALARDYSPDARAAARKLCEEYVCGQCNKRIPSGILCPRCGVDAAPRFGIDYMGYREKLRKEGHPLAEAMTAPVPDNAYQRHQERTAPAKKDVRESVDAPVVRMTKEDIKAESDKLSRACFDSLPALLSCPYCNKDKPKSDFGIRCPRRKSDGMPLRAIRQSRCKPCRRT